MVTTLPPTSVNLRLKAEPVTTEPAELGESPLWDGSGVLRWLDISGRRLFALERDGTEHSVELSTTVTAIEASGHDDLFAVMRTGFGWVSPQTGRVEQRITILAEDGLTMNDAGIDPAGRCWAGSAVEDDSRRGVLYRVSAQGVTKHLKHLGMSNGIDWSPTGDVLYHVDSAAGTLTAWDYDLALGELGESRVLLCVPSEIGLPDGITVDADGNIWLALWGPGQVWRIDARSGSVTAIIDVPTPCTTSCAFGGDDLSTLYITTANYQQPPGGGLLYAVDVPAQGLMPHPFSGTLP